MNFSFFPSSKEYKSFEIKDPIQGIKDDIQAVNKDANDVLRDLSLAFQETVSFYKDKEMLDNLKLMHKKARINKDQNTSKILSVIISECENELVKNNNVENVVFGVLKKNLKANFESLKHKSDDNLVQENEFMLSLLSEEEKTKIQPMLDNYKKV